MNTPNITNTNPDYLVGVQGGHQVLVPVNAPDGQRANIGLSDAQIAAGATGVAGALSGTPGSLFMPDGTQRLATPAYTWATLPAASAYIGNALVTDVGLHGSLWRSDGSTWGLIGGSCVLDRSAAALAAHTGTVALTTLLTRNMPAGLPGPNGAYRWRGKVTTTNNANLKTLFAYIGGSAATGIGYVSQAGGGFDIVIENRGAANSQIGSNGSASGMGSGAWTVGLAIDTAAAHDLTLRATLASAGDSLTIEAWQLELWRP